MRFLSSFKKFIKEEISVDIYNRESEKTLNEISDIFVHVKDCGLEVADVYLGSALSLGDKDIVTDHNEFSTTLGKDGHYVDSYKSLSVRLRTVKGPDQNERPYFYIHENLFEELEQAIKHVESEFNLELGNIYLRMSNGVWFKTVEKMKQYIGDLPFAQKQSLKWVTYLDITFKDLNDKTNESQKASEVDKSKLLEAIFNDVKDILKDLEDEHEIDIDILIGGYHKLISGKSRKGFDETHFKHSINIDLTDSKYNFFRFNDHILPTLKTLKSFLKDYDLKIDIELVDENEYYDLDEFIKEFGSDEFHKLGIIIY